MRLPNGYGSVVRLKGKRRRPYWIRKTIGWNEKGYPKYETIGYAKTRSEGLKLLANFNSGDFLRIETEDYTLERLFQKWSKERGELLGDANYKSLKSSYNYIKSLAHYKYKNIRAYEMQNTINNCGRGYSTQSQIKSLWKHLDRFAMELDIVDKTYSSFITSAKITPKERMPFSENEVIKLWKDYYAGKKNIDIVLIFLYTGFRISELREMKLTDIDLTNRTMKGGIKTEAGKNRIVPIHSAIYKLVKMRAKKNRTCLFERNGKPIPRNTFAKIFNKVMEEENMNHTPHECRHTFESMLDDAGGNRKCIDMLMGHVSKDIGNRVYNHKTLIQLKETVELLKSYMDYVSDKIVTRTP